MTSRCLKSIYIAVNGMTLLLVARFVYLSPVTELKLDYVFFFLLHGIFPFYAIINIIKSIKFKRFVILSFIYLFVFSLYGLRTANEVPLVDDPVDLAGNSSHLVIILLPIYLLIVTCAIESMAKVLGGIQRRTTRN